MSGKSSDRAVIARDEKAEAKMGGVTKRKRAAHLSWKPDPEESGKASAAVVVALLPEAAELDRARYTAVRWC